MALALALASTGCLTQEPARQAPRVAPAVAPADAPWPKAIEVKTINIQRMLSDTIGIDVSLPRFQMDPGTLAAKLNTRFARYTKLKAADYEDFEDSEGTYYAICQPSLVSRFAVVVECGEAAHITLIEHARQGMGGAPAGLTPSLIAVWLQPGLPAIKLSQLAPGINGDQVIAKAIQSAPADCHPEWCEYKPEAFSFDEDGIVFLPVTYCGSPCAEENRPRIPLDQLNPVHPWGVQLVGWLKQRAAANQGFIEGQAR